MGFISDLFGGGDNDNGGGNDYRKEAAELWNELVIPEFDKRKLNPTQYTAGDTINPVVIDPFTGLPIEIDEDGMEYSREVQQAALAKMFGLADDGMDEQTELAADRIRNALEREFKNSDAQVVEDLQRRGRMGGGEELRARLMGSQNRQNMVKELADEELNDAIATRLAAIRDSGDMASAIGNQELDFATRQAQLLNDYETRKAATINRVNEFNATNQMDANRYNVDRANTTRDRNTEIDNTFKINERDRLDDIAQSTFDNEATRIGGKSNALVGVATGADAAEAAKANRKSGNTAALIGAGASIANTIWG